jgi:circadian clock protein KaiB
VKTAAKTTAANKTKAAPAAPVNAGRDFWKLRLYVAGQTPKSLRALANLKRLCEERLRGRYEIEVTDLLVHPHLAKDDQILAIPTLVRQSPAPLRKIIGDLSDTDRVLVGMDLQSEPTRPADADLSEAS